MKKRAILKWKLKSEDYLEIEEFYRSCLQKHIFQSLEWTHVEIGKSKMYAYIFVYAQEKIICFACIEVTSIPPFSVFQGSMKCGPVFQDIATFRSSLPLIIKELKRNKFIYFELNPFWFNQEATVIEQIIIENQGRCIQTSSDYHYISVRIDLNKSEEEIYSQMKNPLKRQIKKSRKIENLTIRDGKKQDCDCFVELFNTMMKAKGSKPRINSIYINSIFKNIIKKKLGFFLIQEYEQKPIAAIIVFLCGNTLVYTYGASSMNYKDIPKSHLLHWEIIKRAKSQMLNFYDLGGVVIGIDEKNESVISGINKFKYGFSENLVTYCRKHRIVIPGTMYYFLSFFRIFKRIIIQNGKSAIKSILNRSPGKSSESK